MMLIPLLGLLGTAVTHAPCNPTLPAVRAVLGLEEQWATALVKRDSAAFERLLGNGFVYSENDRTMSRAEVLHEIVAGADTVTAAHNEDMLVHCFEGTVIVVGWLIVEGRGASGPFAHRYRFTDIWMRQAGRWRIVAAHDFLTP